MQRHCKVSVGTAAAALVAALGFVGSSASQVAAGGSATAAQQWRTPWGHPNLQGTWSSDDVRGIPLQRPEGLGMRAEQTDEEFAERQKGNRALANILSAARAED